jgi:hypothetical protein
VKLLAGREIQPDRAGPSPPCEIGLGEDDDDRRWCLADHRGRLRHRLDGDRLGLAGAEREGRGPERAVGDAGRKRGLSCLDREGSVAGTPSGAAQMDKRAASGDGDWLGCQQRDRVSNRSNGRFASARYRS